MTDDDLRELYAIGEDGEPSEEPVGKMKEVGKTKKTLRAEWYNK